MTAIADTSAPATTASTEMPIAEQVAGFAGRLLDAVVGMMELATIKLGRDLGLYGHLATDALTASELAGRAGTDLRYTTEWLEQQTVAGVLRCDDRTAAPGDRQYTLPPAHAMVLVERASPAYVGPAVDFLAPISGVLPELTAAFRSGVGVGLSAYGDAGRTAQAELNRPGYLNSLAQEWFPAVPDVEARLLAGARVADIGCGTGWSSIALALAYPDVVVDGIDLDDASIADARRNAGEAGVDDRVRLEVANAAAPGLPPGSYDLVVAFETIHDMADPVGALAAMRALASEDGVVLVAENAVSESFATAAGPMDRLFYGSSVLLCLPTGRDAEESAATGAVITPDVLRGYAQRAGFSGMRIEDVPHQGWRFYRLER